MGELWRKLIFLFRRPSLDRDLDEEIRFHLEMRARQTGDRDQARRKFGNIGIVKEVSREMWGFRSLEYLRQDLRYALRQMRRNPGFTAIAALSLGLGIGANTAIFGLIDHVMLRMLPVRDSADLVVIRRMVSYPTFEQIRDRNDVFSGILGTHLMPELEVTIPGNPRGLAAGELVSGSYFETLGAGAALGRTILPEDDRVPESSPVAVISYGYWKRVFGGAPSVLGKKIQARSGMTNGGTSGLDVYDNPNDKSGAKSFEGAVLTIVGVAPPEFFGDTAGASTDIWIPMMMQGSVMPGRPFLRQKNAVWVNVMGRRKPGVTEEQARARLLTVWRQVMIDEEGSQLTERRKREIFEARIIIESGEKGFGQSRRQFSAPLQVLMTVVGLVLLIACLNVANLLLARATARRREIAVRLSMGAGRFRLIRQLLTESLALAALGGLLGVAIAYFGTRTLLALLSEVGRPLNISFEPDLRTLGFTAGVSLVTGILFGLAPAFRATGITLAETMKDTSRGSTGGKVSAAKFLAAAQVAVSMLLLIGTGLFLRTLYNLKAEHLGYNPDHLMLMQIDPISAGYRGDEVGRAMKTILDRIAVLPEVREATFSENGLFSGTESMNRVDVPGYLAASDEDRACRFDQVGPGYFTHTGIPILLGRDISERDLPNAPRAIVINETMAKSYFRDRNAIGRHIKADGFDLEIVGVARDAQDHDLRAEPVRRYYVSYFQPIDGIGAANFEIRTSSGARPSDIGMALRREVQSVNPNLTILSIKDARELIDATLVQERLIAILSAFFGLLAITLAAIGLYGVMSYAVARRTNEIGIRMALGAGAPRVLSMILGEVMFLVGAGALVGLAAAAGSTRLVKSVLFGLTALDPISFATPAAVLAVVGILAGYLPARRASKIDPTVALHYE
jgi:predicted permease